MANHYNGSPGKRVEASGCDQTWDSMIEQKLQIKPVFHLFIITESTIIWIPAKFVHAPFRVLEVSRPFLLVQCQYAPKLTETGLKKLVKEELRNQMIFIDADGKEQDE